MENGILLFLCSCLLSNILAERLWTNWLHLFWLLGLLVPSTRQAMPLVAAAVALSRIISDMMMTMFFKSYSAHRMY